MWQDKYQKLQQLGHGSSGSIWKIYNKTSGTLCAAKIIYMPEDASSLASLQKQIKILTTNNHPNIIKCYGVEIFQQQIWILMQICDGSLSDIMKFNKRTYQQDLIIEYLRQILEALAYLHQKGIIHRDLKASNILIKNQCIKLSDFGVSLLEEDLSSSGKLNKIGSPFWMSPQAISESLYTAKTDIWGLGITVIELAQGEPPFSHQHPYRAMYSIQTHQIKGFKQPKLWSRQLNDFVNLCLTIDYKTRPSARQLLKHSLFKKVNRMQEDIREESEYGQLNDTIIMHEQLPKSIWEKDSYPQTQVKPNSQDTIIVNNEVENDCILSNMMGNQKQKMSGDNIQRQKQVKKLFMSMQEEIKQVRNKYMKQIRSLYLNRTQNENWQSPLNKLKDKKTSFLVESIEINPFHKKLL